MATQRRSNSRRRYTSILPTMRSLLIAAVALMFSPVPTLHAAPAAAPDPALVLGLQSCVANGIDAGVRTWYADRADVAAEMSAKVLGETAKLGSIIDSEVVAVQPISKRVTRYYAALYFTRSPLWVRIDRYQNGEKSFFLPLKCSVNPDEVLPGYITEFYR